MESFREFVAQGNGGLSIDPVKQRRVTDYITNTVLPNMSDVEKAKFSKIFNPNSQLIIPFWQKVAQSNYNVGKVITIARELENDPRLPKTASFVAPNQPNQAAQPAQVSPFQAPQ